MEDIGIKISINAADYFRELNAVKRQTDTAMQGMSMAIGSFAMKSKDIVNVSDSLNDLQAKSKKLRDELGKLAPTSQEFVNKAGQLRAVENRFNSLQSAISGAVQEAKKFSFSDIASQFGNVGQLLAGGGILAAVQIAIGAFQKLSDAVIQFGKDSIQAAANVKGLETALNLAGGGVVSGEQIYKDFKKTANELGLSIESNAKAFKGFVVSATQSGLSLQEAQNIFRQTSLAITATSLSAEDANGVLLALSQIASKGTVSSEELRQQIGERLPGAFAIAARSIGVTEMELNDMLQKGEVVSKDFLPKFANELEKTFGDAAKSQLSGYTAEYNRLQNAITEIKEVFGAALLPIVTDTIRAFSDLAKDLVFSIGLFDEVKKTVSGAISTFTDFVVVMNPFLQAFSLIGGLFPSIKEGFKSVVSEVFSLTDIIRTTNPLLEVFIGFFDRIRRKREEYERAQNLNVSPFGTGNLANVAAAAGIAPVQTSGAGDIPKYTAKIKEIEKEQKKAQKSTEDLKKAANEFSQTIFEQNNLLARNATLMAQLTAVQGIRAIDSGMFQNNTVVPFTMGDVATAATPTFENQAAMLEKMGYDVAYLNSQFKDYSSFVDAAGGSMARFGMELGLTNQKAIEFSQYMQGFKDFAFQQSVNLLSGAFADLGFVLGEVASGTKSAKDAFAVFTKTMLDLILVQVPKLLGVFLLQGAVTLGFPAGIPLALAGLALVGFSGIAGGLLAGMDKRKEQDLQAAASTNIAATTAQQRTAGGLVGDTPKANTTQVNNITVVIESDGIIREIQRQTIVNNELNG